MKKLNLIGALLALALMLGMVVPAQAQISVTPFDEEQLKEIQDWAMSLGDEFHEDMPWEVGQSANFLFRIDGDIPDPPIGGMEIPLNFAITGTEKVGGETFHWLEIVIPDMDFEQSGTPSTYKLGLLVKQLSKEEQQQMGMMQMNMQQDPMAGLMFLKDILAKIRFQQNSDPGMFIDLAGIWPMIEANAPMFEEAMKEMEDEEAEEEMEKIDFTFKGDSGKKQVATPAGSFDSNWMGMRMGVAHTEEKESMDVNVDVWHSAKVPILSLAKFSIGLVPHDIADFPTPVTFTLEAQKIGSNAKTSFVNLDEFQDLGMMAGMMLGGMMGEMGEM